MRKRWLKWLISAGLIALLLSGCGKAPPVSGDIDPPQDESLFGDVLGEHWDLHKGDDVSVITAPVTLYVKDMKDHVAPVTMHIPMTTPNIAQRALEYMIDGSPSSKELPAGFTPLIPEGTTVLGMDIVEADKLAIVDFSSEFANYEAKDERRIVEAITWMLTGFPTIDQVKLRINGEPLHHMPVAGFPLQEPLTRKIGINLEKVTVGNLAVAQPVTLYFKSEAPGGFEYLVPVTRMIDRSTDKVAAVLHELIAGPEQQGMYAVLAPDVKILDIIAGEDLVTVDLNDYVLDPEHRILEESMQSIILSLTENGLAERVQIKVNGNVEVLARDNQSLSQPVTRPSHINVYDL